MKNGTQRCWSRWVLMRSTYPRVKSALMMHNCAYCPYLNSTALPGCNHSPGTVMANSSLTANVPFTLPHGVGWWATLAHSESRQCVHDHKGSNTRISGYSSAKGSCYSFAEGKGIKAWGLTKVLTASEAGGRTAMLDRNSSWAQRHEQVQEWEQPLPLPTLTQ